MNGGRLIAFFASVWAAESGGEDLPADIATEAVGLDGWQIRPVTWQPDLPAAAPRQPAWLWILRTPRGGRMWLMPLTPPRRDFSAN